MISSMDSVSAISSARGNYGYGQQYGRQVCDKNVYDRAKEMIRLEMQQQRTGNPSDNYDSRYPPLTNSYQMNNNTFTNRNYLHHQLNDHQCKLMRQAFDDLLINTPLCESIGSYQFQVASELIKQSREFLKQHCERNQGWFYAECFKRREILDCESRFNNSRLRAPHLLDNGRSNYNNQFDSIQKYNLPVSYELCQTFDNFRNCVITQSRFTCRSDEMDLLGTYFVDKAQNLAWSCIPTNQMNVVSSGGDVYSRRTDINMNQYQPANPNQQPGSGYYPQPPYSSYPNVPNTGITISPYQGVGVNQPLDTYSSDNIDRAGAGGALSGLHAGSVSACIERVRPFITSCLDHLIMRQREARYGRSSTDVQRRICCALFRYRDCLSRVVLERCYDNSRVTVDILMGDRNREITQTCRDITRDQCNGSKNLLASINSAVVSIILTLTIWIMNSN